MNIGVDLKVPHQPTHRGKLTALSEDAAILDETGLPPLHPGDSLQIGITVQTGRESRHIRLQSQVIRQSDKGLEVKLQAPPAADAAIVSALLARLRRDAEREKEQQREHETTAARINAIVRTSVGKEVTEMVKQLFQTLIDDLRQASAQAPNNDEQVRLSDDAGRLEQNCRKENLSLRIARELLRCEVASPHQDTPPPSARLFDTVDTEHWLAATSLIECLESHLDAEYKTICAAHPLFQNGTLVAPLAFSRLADAIERQLHTLDISTPSRVSASRTACSVLVPLLSPIYRRLAKALLETTQGSGQKR